MKTIEINLYKFDELSEEAKQTAIEKWRESNYETGEVLHFFYENSVEFLKEKGFKNPVLKYSLSSSQGDGFSFRADDYEFLHDLVLEAVGTHHPYIAAWLSDHLIVHIRGNQGRYTYASESDIELELDYYADFHENVDGIILKVERAVKDIYMELCKQLEREGYEQIEYENSDEYIIEAIEANDYDFTEEGELY